jgi:heme-degrading monooxygenase HmoA
MRIIRATLRTLRREDNRPTAASALTKESGMYARVVVYTHTDDRDELEAKARAGAVPIVTSSDGYISYGVIVQDTQVISISQWESEGHAKAADAALGEWVKANTSMQSETRYTGDLAWLELAPR